MGPCSIPTPSRPARGASAPSSQLAGAGADCLGPGEADRRPALCPKQRMEPTGPRQRAARSRLSTAGGLLRQSGRGRRPRRYRAVRYDIRLHDPDLCRRSSPAHRQSGDRHRSEHPLGPLFAGRVRSGAGPPNAQPSAGSDSQITIYQPSTNRLWEYWHFNRQRDGWHARWGGAMDDVSNSPGYYTPSAWSGLAIWGASATSLPLVAGTMTLAELRAGHIDDALAITIPRPRAGVVAGRHSARMGSAALPSCPKEPTCGSIPHLNIPAMHLPKIVEMIALAAQRYGIIVRDQSFSDIGFFAEDPTQYGAKPYTASDPYYGVRRDAMARGSKKTAGRTQCAVRRHVAFRVLPLLSLAFAPGPEDVAAPRLLTERPSDRKKSGYTGAACEDGSHSWTTSVRITAVLCRRTRTPDGDGLLLLLRRARQVVEQQSPRSRTEIFGGLPSGAIASWESPSFPHSRSA